MRAVGSSRQKKRRGKKVTVEKCNSLTCIFNYHDINVRWAQCDMCDEWLHSRCESLTPVEQLMATDESSYICLRYFGKDNILEVLEKKIEFLLGEEETINLEIIGLKSDCDNLKARYVYSWVQKKKTCVTPWNRFTWLDKHTIAMFS